MTTFTSSQTMNITDKNKQPTNDQNQSSSLEELVLMLIGKDSKAQEHFRKQVLRMARTIRKGHVTARSGGSGLHMVS